VAMCWLGLYVVVSIGTETCIKERTTVGELKNTVQCAGFGQ
jgi:hypothetical protein